MARYPWEIVINLDENRYKTGTLNFYIFKESYDGNSKAKLIYSCDCLGRGTVASSSASSWKKECGNTPTGTSTGTLGGPKSDVERYGPNKYIRLHPVSGNIEKAYSRYGRNGILIHGGRSQIKLWNTNGCIRVFNNDLKSITEYIEDNCRDEGTIKIFED